MGVLRGPNSGGLFIRDFRLEDDGPFLVGYRDRPSAGHPSRLSMGMSALPSGKKKLTPRQGLKLRANPNTVQLQSHLCSA
jgi:hypothetical protein